MITFLSINALQFDFEGKVSLSWFIVRYVNVENIMKGKYAYEVTNECIHVYTFLEVEL